MGEIKNPFSLSEFLGYLFPGALGVCLIYIIIKRPDLSNLYNYDKIVIAVSDVKGILDTEIIVFSTLISYVFGHFIAYLSSITIEQFSIWSYGYPSEYLLEKKDAETNKYLEVYNKRINNLFYLQDSILNSLHALKFKTKESLKYIIGSINFWRAFLLVFLLPITICTFLFSWLLGLKTFFIKNMEDELIDTVNYKTKILATHLSVPYTNDNKDFHRMIYHYEYEHQKAHHIKTDNYVALYDFLRAVTLISNCVFLYVSYKYILSDFGNNFLLKMSLIALVMTYVFYIAFLKFYRRFTQENFMCLIIDNTFMTKKDKE